MINRFWLFFIATGIIIAGINGRIDTLTPVILETASKAVNLAIGLVAIMTFWLGIMKLIEKSGLLRIIVRLLEPLAKFLYPSVPLDHPAMSSILMNMSANILGMGSAATPLGIQAMKQLEELNPEKGTASPAMCTFLALNTSSLTLIPTTVIALRAAAGSVEPTRIVGPTILATFCSTIVAVTLDKMFRHLRARGNQS